MKFFHSTVILLCVTLLFSFFIFAGCATSTASDQTISKEGHTAVVTESETDGKSGEKESSEAIEGAAGAISSKNVGDKKNGTSANGETSDSDIQQRITLPPSREIPVGQLMELVGRNVPPHFIFLSDNTGNPLRIYHDLDQNGYEDIFLLLVEFPETTRKGSREDDGSASGSSSDDNGPNSVTSNRNSSDDTAQIQQAQQSDPQPQSFVSPELDLQPENSQADAIIHDRKVAASDLADMSRLFSEEIRPHKFYLALFLRTPRGLVSMYRIPLGSWFVFEEFRGCQLNEQRAMPYAVSISFQTHEGKESQWVCFSDYNEFSFFTLKNSISVTTENRDINNNGFLDILEWRKVFEEGTGYETFLTWYKWDGSKYTQHDTINIVRNLNQFLHTTSSLLSLGKWSQAFSLLLPDKQYQQMMEKNNSMGKLFIRLFPSQPGSDDSETLDDAEIKAMIDRGERVFNTVIVPRVLENPFAGEKRNLQTDYRTRFSIRFILRDGRSIVRECSVRMNENPFAGTQYFIEAQ